MDFIQFLMRVEMVSQIRFLLSLSTKFTFPMGSPSEPDSVLTIPEDKVYLPDGLPIDVIVE
jgi:hypothetical protein